MVPRLCIGLGTYRMHQWLKKPHPRTAKLEAPYPVWSGGVSILGGTKMTDMYDIDVNEQPVDLKVIREKAVELRDLYLEKQDIENKLKNANEKIVSIERHELVDMFNDAGLTSVTVEPDGNHPAFVASRNTIYSAAIPEDKRMEAFQWFETNGHGDLVKSVIEIVFGMQEFEKRLRVMKLLDDNGVEYWNNESVHHMTLKAFVKRELQAGHVLPADLLGSRVFDEIKIK
jgi:hypothetical protein